jgi:hypothetical protein
MRDAADRSGAVTIGIVAGEASGDALAATLIETVRAQMPEARFVGVAGPKMEAAGCEVWHPLDTLSVGGFTEVLSRLPEIVSLRRDVERRMVAEKVPLFIGVDAPDFNLGLERKLKRRGVRTVHLVSPSVWAWRRGRVAMIGRAVHRILVLFPFEPPIYEAKGVRRATSSGSASRSRSSRCFQGAVPPSSKGTAISCSRPPRRFTRRVRTRASSFRLRRGRRATGSRSRAPGRGTTSRR